MALQARWVVQGWSMAGFHVWGQSAGRIRCAGPGHSVTLCTPDLACGALWSDDMALLAGDWAQLLYNMTKGIIVLYAMAAALKYAYILPILSN